MIVTALDALARTHGTDAVKRAYAEWSKRLKIGRAVERRRPIPRQWLQDAYSKSNGTCVRCGLQLDFSDATGDHKIPLAHGGKHNRHNIACVCKECNSRKGSKTPHRESKASGRTVKEILS